MRTRRLLALGALSSLALTGCGTALGAQTYKELHNRDFNSTDVGDLALRNLAVDPPLSGSVITQDSVAIVTGSVVNSSDTPDAITSVSSPVAATAQLQVHGADVAQVPIAAHGDAADDWAVVLSGLTKDLPAGTYIPITLTFADAGRSQTLMLPVRSGDTGLGDRTADQNPYQSDK